MIIVYNTEGKIIITCNYIDPVKSYIEDNELNYIETEEEIDLINFQYKIINGEIIKGDPTPKPEILENK